MTIEIPKFIDFAHCYRFFTELPKLITKDLTSIQVVDLNLDLEIEATGSLLYDQVVYYKTLLKGGRANLDANKHKLIYKWKQDNQLL